MALPEFTRATLPAASGYQDQQVLVIETDGTRTLVLSDGTNWVGSTTAQALALTNPMAAATGAIPGFVGRVTADNFGMNWIRRPISFDGITGTLAALDNDNGAISKYAGTESTGWVRMFFGFNANGAASGLFTSGTTTFVDNRRADLVKALRFWHGLGKKVLLVLDGPVTNSSTDAALFRDRLQTMFLALDQGYLASVGVQQQQTGVYIDAIEPLNEPYGPMLNTGGTFVGNPAGAWAKCAEVMRILYTVTKAMSPRTICCSASFQGGEGAAVEAILAASAAGVAVRGDGGGTGTRGEMFCDVLTFHPYDNCFTVADALQNTTQARTEQTIRTYSAWIKTAVTNRRLDIAGGGAAWWTGKADPECWATELNVSPAGGNITSNTAFRMSAFNMAQRKRHLQAVVLGCFASGYSKVFPYAPDHAGDIGAWAPTTLGTSSNGIDLRITASPVGCFDGDLVLSAGTNFSGYIVARVANANSAGTAFDLVGVPASYVVNYQTATRWLLGGWHKVWPEIQAELMGEMEAGFYPAGAGVDAFQPQVRIGRGFVRRVIGGKLTSMPF